eukprot:TRINITY_DN9892_c5_g1_i1.p1 TRINITY_DN9892_c5_g1~~TRINITY_DN9892_c5_g1_i1.p1  ORF type:complete len:766 (+),score=230.39 TRINITY_DN9892_c5_g1_i1:84-2381(+)
MADGDEFLGVAPTPPRAAANSAERGRQHTPAAQPVFDEAPSPPPAERAAGGFAFVLILSRAVGTVLLNCWPTLPPGPLPAIESSRLAELICAFQTFFRFPERSCLRLGLGVRVGVASSESCCVALCGSALPSEQVAWVKARHICDIFSRAFERNLALLAQLEEHAEEKFSTSRDIIKEHQRSTDPREPPGVAPYTAFAPYAARVLLDDSLSAVGAVGALERHPSGALLAALWRPPPGAAPCQAEASGHSAAPSSPGPDAAGATGTLLLAAGCPALAGESGAGALRRLGWAELQLRALAAPTRGSLWPRVARFAAAVCDRAAAQQGGAGPPPVGVLECSDARGGVLRAAVRAVRLCPAAPPVALLVLYSAAPLEATTPTPGGGGALPLRPPVVRCAETDPGAGDAVAEELARMAARVDTLTATAAGSPADALHAALSACGVDASELLAAAAAGAEQAEAAAAAARAKRPQKSAAPPPAAARAPAPAAAAGSTAVNPLSKSGRVRTVPEAIGRTDAAPAPPPQPAAPTVADFSDGDTVALAPGARRWGVLEGGAPGTVAGRKGMRIKVAGSGGEDFYLASHLIFVSRGAAVAAPAPAAPETEQFADGDVVRLNAGARQWGVLDGGVQGVVRGRKGMRVRVTAGGGVDFYLAGHLEVCERAEVAAGRVADRVRGDDLAEHMDGHVAAAAAAASMAAGKAPAPGAAPAGGGGAGLQEGDRVALRPDARQWGALGGGASGVVVARKGMRLKVAVGGEEDFYLASHLRPAD